MPLHDKLVLAAILFAFTSFGVTMATLSWLDGKRDTVRLRQVSRTASKKHVGAMRHSIAAHN